MKFLTRDIFPFYKENKEDSWYLDKFFTNTSEVGNYSPFQEGAVSSSRRSEGKEVDTVDEVNTYKINFCYSFVSHCVLSASINEQNSSR